MQFRDFGKVHWKVSALGFGCMRLPTLDGKPSSGNIDKRESEKMIRHAIDRGVNYLDTAYSYHDGESEVLLGAILKGRLRDEVRLATKSPVWMIRKPGDFDTYLEQQIKRLRTGQIDFYLFHGLNKKSWRSKVLKQGLLRRAEIARDKGKIGHLGFSFHDDYEAFREIVDGHDGWDFCQIQYNYMDVKNQAGTKGLRYAASKGLGVIVMEPLLGGKLANPPSSIRKMIEQHGKRRSPADLALRWIWNQPEVSVVLSGMSAMKQVKENLRSADISGVGSLGVRELKLVDRVRAEYEGKAPIRCTKCGYCMPCPNGVDIPANFEAYNDGFVHGDVEGSRNSYARFMKKRERAANCKQCGECEAKCPQKLPVSDLMPKVHSVLGLGEAY